MVDYDHWCFNKQTIDYRKVLDNNKQYLWSHCDFTHIDYYASTYHSQYLDHLNNNFNFKNLRINEFDNTSNSMSRNRRFTEVLNLILPNYTDYNFILITRFDLRYIDYPFKKNINTTKVNLLYRAKWGNDDSICDDNFYYIPQSKFFNFYNIITELDLNIHSHQYNQYYKDFHYMVDGCFYSHESPVYHISRHFPS